MSNGSETTLRSDNIGDSKNFTIERSRTRCLNFSDILKVASPAEYFWNSMEILKGYGSLIWPAAPPCPCGAGSSYFLNFIFTVVFLRVFKYFYQNLAKPVGKGLRNTGPDI